MVLEVDPLLVRSAGEIQRRGLATPAIFLLELHRPLSAVVRESTRFFSPLLIPFLGAAMTENLLRLLEDPANIERLIVLLEQGRE